MTTALDHDGNSYLSSQDVLGDIEWWWHVDVSEDGVCTIVWCEELAWHAEVHRLPLIDRPDLTEEGTIRAGVVDALQSELRRLLGTEEVDVQDAAELDEPTVEVSVTVHPEPATIEQLAELAWPVVATLTNVMDPGTFGSEYVMGNVGRTIGEA